jgi:hypothetical protein
LVLAAAAALVGCASGGLVDVPPGTTLIVLRHADRQGPEGDLSDLGRARSRALVGALSEFEIDAIYAPGVQRNLDTAAPLAADRQLTVNWIPTFNLASRLMENGRGKTIVWVGNKGNLADLWKSLALPDPPPLEYGDLYIVKAMPGSAPRVDRRRFEP